MNNDHDVNNDKRDWMELSRLKSGWENFLVLAKSIHLTLQLEGSVASQTKRRLVALKWSEEKWRRKWEIECNRETSLEQRVRLFFTYLSNISNSYSLSTLFTSS
jgi:hypothetical protein